MAEVARDAGALAVGFSLWRGGSVLVGQDWYGLPAAFMRAYTSDYMDRDPWSSRIHRLAAGTLVDADGLVPRETFRDTAFYEDLCRPHGVQDLCGGVVLRSGAFTMTFGLLRAADASGGGAREIGLANALLPDLTALAQAEIDRLRIATSSQLSSALSVGAFVVDVTRRRILDANSPAERLLERGIVVARPTGILVDGEGLELSRAATVTMRFRTRALGVATTVLPITQVGDRVVRCLYVHHAPSVAHERVVRAARLYQLSPREASVAELMLVGKAPKEIAAHHGVEISTLRTQVRSLYAKVGVDRQAALVAVLTEF